MRFNNIKSRIVGLDIRQEQISLVMLVKQKRGYLLEVAATKFLPREIFDQGKVKQWHPFQQLLANLVEEQGLANKPAVLNFPATNVNMHSMNLPKQLNYTEIHEEIRCYLKEQFSGFPEELAIDFTVLSSQRNHCQIQFAATCAVYLKQLVSCITQVGLQVKIVDVDIYALKRAICYALHPHQNKHDVIALIYILNNLVTLLVFDRELIIFYQQWCLSADNLFLVELKKYFKIVFARFTELTIQQFILCAPFHYHDLINEDMLPTKQWTIYQPVLLSRLQIANELDQQAFSSKEIAYLMAIGAAMRELPLW